MEELMKVVEKERAVMEESGGGVTVCGGEPMMHTDYLCDLLDELGKIATRYGILSNGYLVEEISKEELEERCRSFLVVRTDDGEAAANLLQAQRGDISFNRVQNDLHILTYVESWELNAFLVRNGVKVHEMYVKSVGVENFFIERMGR